MKRNRILALLVFPFIFSACVVISFYPLYTTDDLFPNELLLGKWMDQDSSLWKFDYAYNGKEIPENCDSTSYILKINERNNEDFGDASLLVHVVRLKGHYFLDFYLDDYFDELNPTLFDFHLMPVHTFAKLEINGDGMTISWFNPEWLEKKLEKGKIRIRHEDNGEHILLTAKTKELQKFVIKYANQKEAFEDGLVSTLKKVN